MRNMSALRSPMVQEWNRGDRGLTAPQFVERVKRLYQRHGFTQKDFTKADDHGFSSDGTAGLWRSF